MNKVIKILIIIILSIVVLTIAGEAFSRLSNSLYQFLLFILAVAVITAGIYFILKLIKK